MKLLVHPRPRSLTHFVDGEGTSRERERIARHLVMCVECRSRAAFQQDLREAARKVAVPQAGSELLTRILADRARGERMILPVEHAAGTKRPAIRVLGMLAAAALVVALGIDRYRSRPHAATGVAAADTIWSMHDLFAGAGFLPGVAAAHELPPRPAVPGITGIDGTKLVPRRYAYEIRNIDSAGRVSIEGEGQVDVSAAQYEGAPAWRISHSATFIAAGGQRRADAETLHVAQRDLRPLARFDRVAPYRRYSEIVIRQRFVGDSVLGLMTTDGGVRRPIARRLPVQFGPYVTDALSPVFLMAVKLHADWRGSASDLGWAVVPRDVFLPVTLSVVGSERITGSGGTFDCWKIRIHTSRDERFEWVRKTDGLSLLVRAPLPAMKGTREIRLKL